MSLPPVNRLGVFGGAFDPPHLAHVALVEAAVAALQLDQVRVLPTGLAWHKTRTLSEAHHRLAMTRLAYQHLPQVVVDDREIRRSGASYTVDTLRGLRAGGDLTNLAAAPEGIVVSEPGAKPPVETADTTDEPVDEILLLERLNTSLDRMAADPRRVVRHLSPSVPART